MGLELEMEKKSEIKHREYMLYNNDSHFYNCSALN